MTNLLLVDDHGIVRQGLKALLQQEPELVVAAECDNGRQAVEVVMNQQIDLVIMDVAMPELNGIEAARQIRQARPEVKIIGLSMHADRRFVSEMLKAGAMGYVLKEAAFEELLTAVREVMAGRSYLSPAVTGVVVEDHVRGAGHSGSSAYARLSPREREILQLVAEGKAMKEIATMLGVSIKTVETHRRAIMDKLQLYSVAELTKYAIREGLTNLEVAAGS
jgi:DNA-binding NarL/FixJ family response regulator